MFKRFFEHRAIILMYHRIAELESDIWDIAVTAENFEQHLHILKQNKNVISLKELLKSIQKESKE